MTQDHPSPCKCKISSISIPEYRCKFCSYAFTIPNSLIKHETKLYQCKKTRKAPLDVCRICGVTFESVESCRKHDTGQDIEYKIFPTMESQSNFKTVSIPGKVAVDVRGFWQKSQKRMKEILQNTTHTRQLC